MGVRKSTMRGAAGLSIAATLLAATAAVAQRTEENVTTQSSDAFGRTVGNEKSGLYNNEEVRGFNPVDAGNVRLEGLYFDQVDRLSARVTDGNSILIGLSARHFPFPAPTGLVDHHLTKPGSRLGATLSIDSGSTISQGPGGSLEFKLPLDGDRLGLAVGVGGRNFVNADGSKGRARTNGAVLAFRPGAGAEILLFAGNLWYRDDEARLTLYPAGAAPPPQLERMKDLTQSWTDRNVDNRLAGGLVKLPVGDFRLEAGLFRAERKVQSIYSDLLFGVGQDGSVASRIVVADGNNRDTSLSGEVRLSRQFRTGSVDHLITLGLRGRAKDRTFGGSRRLDLGASTLLLADPRLKPDYVLGPKNRDEVRQLTPGIAYSMAWKDHATLDISVARTSYRKQVDFADPAAPDLRARDNPMLWSVAGSWDVTRGLTAYAGVAHGQEEALIAPDVASNRSESPPAIHTRQVEAGLRLAVTPKLAVVAGLFSITKPYFNLDPALRYRQLGTLNNRGLELSVTGELAPGLNLVGGTMLLDPRIRGEAVDVGLIGLRPVGQIGRRSVANLDWRPQAGTSPLSFDLAVESLSSRMANAANSFSAPPRTTVNLGARYRFTLGKTRLLLRPLVQNLFDAYGWNVSSSGGFTYIPGRAANVQLIADF